MKRIAYILIIAAAAAASAGCQDLLNTSPTDQISSGNMWTTPDLALKGMNGLYETFYNRKQSKGTQVRWENLDGLNKYGIEGLGFCSDYYANNYPLALLSNEQKQAGDVQINHDWRFCYTIVHSANDAIANLNKAGLDNETYERYICEAKFLRAWAYSRLNRFWWGVPIYTEPVTNEKCNKTQDTAYNVWNLVLDDLNYCIDNPNFPDNTLVNHKGRPSKAAAYALRGMAYMWMAAKDEDAKQRPDGDAAAALYYENAEKDFAKVGELGHSLFSGNYIDLFSPENEQDPEMIFTIQYDAEQGYRDNIQQALGARDTYGGWTEVKPSADWVDYFQNADGTKFDWSQVPGLEDWNSLTAKQRAVFFCRDGLNTATLATQKKNAVAIIGETTFDTYYKNEGNEARIKAAYDNRDPRLKQSVVTPYEPVDCYANGSNGNEEMIGKQLRWPLFEQGTNGGDFWLDKRSSAFYCYRKYVRFHKGELVERDQCYTDFPLIRYTDVYLQRAEALIELNRFNEAKVIIDQVRSRAGMPGITVGNLAAMREAVRYERRIELAVEALNYFDEIRWGTYRETKFQGKDIHGGQSWWGDDSVEYPWYYQEWFWPWAAPKGEYQMNPAIVQRPNWIY